MKGIEMQEYYDAYDMVTVPRELLQQALDFVDHLEYPQRLKAAC